MNGTVNFRELENPYPANIYLLKVKYVQFNKKDTRRVFIVNFEHVSQLFVVFLLLTLNKLFTRQSGETLFLNFQIWGEAIQLDVFS